MRRRSLFPIFLALTGIASPTDAKESNGRAPVRDDAQVTQQKRSQIDGDTAYKASCIRCHAAPEKSSPRKTPMIMLHMRVRANLTEAETQAILEYLTQ